MQENEVFTTVMIYYHWKPTKLIAMETIQTEHGISASQVQTISQMS